MRPPPLPRDPKHPGGSPEHNLSEKELAQRFPFDITLRFYDHKQFDAFIGGLLDGWGENCCDLVWPGWASAHKSRVFACVKVDGDHSDDDDLDDDEDEDENP